MVLVARPLLAAQQRRPRPPAAAVAAEVAVLVVLRHIVEFHIPAEVHTQFLVDTVCLVMVDIVLVAGIAEVEDTEWVPHHQWDTGLIALNCRKVELRYIVRGCPCFSLCLCSCSVNINETINQHVKAVALYLRGLVGFSLALLQ